VNAFVRSLSVCALAFLVASAVADEKKPDAKKPDEKPAAANTGPFAFPPPIKLSEDQQKKVDALKAEYQPKLQELTKKTNAVLRPEQRKARAEARKKAMDDGKKGAELNKAVEAAAVLDADQQTKMKEIAGERKTLTDEIRKKMLALLTDEQRKSIEPKPKNDK
jgi:hypothetical protein